MGRLALIAASAIVLAGCGGSSAAVSLPPVQFPLADFSPVVVMASHSSPDRYADPSRAHFVSRTRLAILTRGTGSCPRVPDGFRVENRHRIEIHLTDGSWVHGRLVAHHPPGDACTADLRKTQIVIAIDPKRIDVHRRLEIVSVTTYDPTGDVATAPALKG